MTWSISRARLPRMVGPYPNFEEDVGPVRSDRLGRSDRSDGQNLGKDKLPRMVGPLLSPLPMGMRLLVGPYTPTMEMTPPFRTDLPQPDGPA